MKIKVDGCFLTPARIIAGTKGSFDTVRVELCFGKDWEGLDKSVVFHTPTGKNVRVSCDDGRLRIPDEVMATRGKSSFAVIGKDGGKRKTTLPCELYVLNSVDGVDEV